MSTHPGCNQYKHAPGCGHPGATGGPAEVAGVDLTAQEAPPYGALVAPCPDCGAPMVGHIGDGYFLPGSQCEECGHTAAVMEVETEASYDEDGRTYLYTLNEDGEIRVTDDDGNTVMMAYPDHDDDWGGLNPFDVERDAVAQAVAVRDDPHAFVADQCDDADLPVMGHAYSILLDRETLPAAHLLGSVNPDDVEAHYEQYVGPAVDALAAKYDRGSGFPADGAMSNLRATCHEAGLESMAAFYGVVADRGCLTETDAWSMTADQVSDDYAQYVEPALDRLEQRLALGYSDERIGSQFADIDAAVRSLTEAYPGADTRPIESAVAAAYQDAWSQTRAWGALDSYAGDLDRIAEDIIPQVAAIGGGSASDEAVRRVQTRLRASAERLRKAADGLGLGL